MNVVKPVVDRIVKVIKSFGLVTDIEVCIKFKEDEDSRFSGWMIEVYFLTGSKDGNNWIMDKPKIIPFCFEKGKQGEKNARAVFQYFKDFICDQYPRGGSIGSYLKFVSKSDL